MIGYHVYTKVDIDLAHEFNCFCCSPPCENTLKIKGTFNTDLVVIGETLHISIDGGMNLQLPTKDVAAAIGLDSKVLNADS